MEPSTKFDLPKFPTVTAVIVLPGMSGGAVTERFQPLVETLLGLEMAVYRMDVWQPETIGDLTVSRIQDALDKAAEKLRTEGYTRIFAIGKSFGGAMVLLSENSHIARKVLWAPAIGVAERGNVEEVRDIPFSNVGSPLSIRVDREYLQRFRTPILLVHGTEDTVIPIGNSQLLKKLLPDAALDTISGADHSYRMSEHELELLDRTATFLAA